MTAAGALEVCRCPPAKIVLVPVQGAVRQRWRVAWRTMVDHRDEPTRCARERWVTVAFLSRRLNQLPYALVC